MGFCFQKASYSLAALLLLFCLSVSAQEETAKESLKLFTDCNCDKRYVQQEINFVGHVRDQGLANIMLFIYDAGNGSGGRTYRLEFEGAGDYEGITNKSSFDSNANMTNDEVRKGLVKTIKTGLLKYVLASDLADKITYEIPNIDAVQDDEANTDDPWKNWIFEIYGEAELEKETSRRRFDYELGFESDKVNEKWRVRTDLQINQSNSEFDRDDETFTSKRSRYAADGSVVRSLSDHWSTGIFVGGRHDTFTNLDFRYYINPALEYNVFPYSEVLRREITFAYRIGFFQNDYIDTTIFGEDEEAIFSHSLDVQVNYRQPWGNLFSRLRASSFLDDFTKNRVQLFGRFSIRIFKGLATRFSGRFEIIRDQINLPAGDASIEDVLLQQKQIATDFELGFSVGLSYTFGSTFNNIINTRL